MKSGPVFIDKYMEKERYLDIRKRKYTLSYKKVRIKDIAKRLGISTATVSQALNHPKEVNRRTRQEILSLCEELGYLKPVRGKKRVHHIAIISRDTYNFANDFYAKVCEALLDYARKYKYNLILTA